MTDSVTKEKLRRPISATMDSDGGKGNVITLSEGGISYCLILPHHHTDYIQHRIMSESRPYEAEMLEDMKSRVQPGDHVIDVGANVGNHTVYLAAVTGCHVTAFEPNPVLSEAIRASARMNGLDDRILVHQAGVGAAAGRGRFTHLDQSNLGAQHIEISDGADSPVEIVSLDGLNWLHRIQAIKIDVEGMELAVLQGAIHLIERDHPTIYVECQTELDFEAIHDFLSGHGYSCVMTFNATPTQLYLHKSQLVEDQRLEGFLTDRARREYRAAKMTAELRRNLDEANAKYRNANEKISALRHKLDSANEKYRQVTQSLVTIKQKQRDDLALARETTDQTPSHEQINEEMHTTIRLMEAELRKTEQNYLQAQEQISNLNFELSVANEAKKQAADRQAILDAELQTANKRLEEETEALTRRYRASEQALAAARAGYVELERNLSDITERLNTVEVELKQAYENQYVLNNLHQEEYAGLAKDISDKYHHRTVEQILAFKQKVDTQNQHISTLEIQLKSFKTESARKLAELRGSATYQAGAYLREAARSWQATAGLPLRLWRLWRAWRVNRRLRVRQASGDPAPGLRHIPPASQVIDDITQRIFPERSARMLRVACIMDDFTFSSFAPECELHPLTPAAWLEEITESRPDLLFIESAWRGKDELWGSKVGHTCQELQGIIQWCRFHRIPTVFWNKEDPIHYETFLNTARLVDFIFTTDIDCIQRYKAALGHNRVYLLPFACQPKIHNPVEKYQREDAFCFAGAYYTRYPERTRDLECFVRTLPSHRPLVIYDRNHGKDHPDYCFPEGYRPYIIGSLPFAEIDKAYKGYQYAINLNSIKQSQTMFARRVYELLASNTITVSNYSRGLRLLFGDLVLCSDNGDEIVKRLSSLSTDEARLRKFRLSGLRKVMKQHTYQDRLSYIVAKIEGKAMPRLLPAVLVTAYAGDQAQFDRLLGHFMRQTHPEKRLLMITGNGFQPKFSQDDTGVTIVQAASTEGTLADCTGKAGWIAGMVSDDYYGPNYLTDLVIATRYCSAPVIGKVAHYVWSAGAGLTLTHPDAAYRGGRQVSCRSAIVKLQQVGQVNLLEWTTGLHRNMHEDCDVQAIDEFNYCNNGAIDHAALEAVESAVNDLTDLDEGIELSDLIDKAERIFPEETHIDRPPVITGAELAKYFRPKKHRHYQFSIDGQRWMIESILSDGKHEYVYAARDVSPTDLGFDTHARFHLDVSPGLNIQLVMQFLDRSKERIGHIISPANRNIDAEISEGTVWIRLGIRIYSSGSTSINGLVLNHRSLQPTEVIGRSRYLLLTNHYPSYDDLYRNAFIHTRVKGYLQQGVTVDVFRLRTDEALSYHEYQNIDVITGSQEALRRLLANGCYQHVLVHFLDQDMWSVLKEYIDILRVTVWVHGAEIHPWYRRKFNIDSPEQEISAKQKSEKRLLFWQELLKQIPPNFKLVFVSNTFAEEAMEDLGLRLSENQYAIIHNPIDTELFKYVPKSPDLRKKILSIRPYASRQYANDQSVKAIQLLSKKDYFEELEFRLIGDGILFDATVAPLRGMKNVIIEKRFMTQTDIADLHKKYGVFLCPTRWDSQGVSRDEAMSSGLVPVTSLVAAIPEFVNDSCAMLSEPESISSLADCIERLYMSPDEFERKSLAAAEQIRKSRRKDVIIERELNILAASSNE